jgi:large repetitive protein
MITGAVTLVTAGLVTGLVYSQAAAAAPVSVPSPVSGGWQLNGSAVLNTSASPPNLELTPATNWVVGSAFYPTAVPGVGISAAFDIFIGSGNGADGMTFTLADASVTQPTALGNNGGGEGFSGITGIAVSFDTWQNTNDPSNNFVGIATTNSPQQQLNYVATNVNIPALRNTVHHVVVTTNSTGITVTMDGTQVLNYATALPSNVLLGFTGATGGFNDIHQVQNVNITVGPPPAAPAVTSLSPTSGPTAGGTSVTVTGSAFTGASSVMFGSTPATSYTVNSDTSITATVPAGNAGKVDVTVATAGGTSAVNSGDQYSYVAPPPTVTNINPNSGPAGTSVTVTGTNFTGATEVDFGSGNKATFTVGSATTLTATAPAGTGTVDVTVITASGTSATSTADQFTYAAAPPPGTIPSPVQGGWQLNGNAVLNATASPPNLQLTPAVNWEVGSAFWPKAVTGVGISASFDIFIGSGSGADGLTFTLADASQTQPTALGNNGGGLGFSGIHGFAVAFDTWQSSVNPSNNFVGIGAYNSPQQQVNYVATNTNIPAIRNTVHHITVTTNSTGITVTMDGAQVLNYATSLPSQVLVGFTGATGGFNDIHQVQNVNITTGPPPPAPTVTSVTPNSGPTTGGTQVTIGGTNLTGATGVQFGTTQATNVTVNSATSITATAPAGNAGAVDVTVTTAGGTSATSSADQFTYVVPPPPPPTVTVVSPTTAPAGSSVTVSGSNFTSVTAVDFGSNNATFTVNNSTTLTATAPAGSGTVDVTVTNAGGTSKTSTADQFTYGAGAPPGSIPSPVAGGWQLNGSSVLNTSASPANLQLTPTTNWVAGSAFWPSPVASAGISAAFDIFIGSSSTSGADGMTFTLADASVTKPTALGNNGGGEGFSGITGIAVSFDTWKNTNDPSNNFVGIATTNTAQQQLNYVTTNSSIPALRNTVHHIVVTTNTNGISVTMDGNLVLAYNITLPSQVLIGFTGATGGFNDVHRVQNVNISVGALPPPPAVTAVSPTSGPTSGGSVVTITGTGFTGATSVKFGNTAATNFSINNDTNITATAPAGTAGTVDVTVVGPGGISATGSADQFTYTPPPVPTVTGVSPTSGPNTGGTPVTITGTGFTGATAVHFGSGNTATFTVTNDTTIAATAPPNATLGAVDITVTTPGGTSATSTADQFTFVTPPPPTVTAVTPNAGPGLTSVTIAGTNFSGATAVNFGANSSSFTVDSPTQITATAPSGPTSGTVDVTVTTPGGTSAKSSADQFTYQAGEPPVTMVATYRGDLGDSGYYPSQTGVTAANVATLNTKWTDGTGTAVGSYAQPIVANNLIYWGDWNGVEHATNFSGKDVWTVNTGQNVDSACSPPVAGVSGTATLATIGGLAVDYFPGGDVNMYAVNALTGVILWKTKLGNGGSGGDYLWGSPVLYNGNLYQPVASFGDCPLVNGRLVEMNPYTGAIENTAYMENAGCTGGGIWSSPTVDASDGSIYVSTGTPTGCTKTNEMAPALVKLRASDLTVLSSWTVPKSAQQTGDSDFGSTPVLFTAKINGVTRNLVGCLNKNGIFYAWDRTNVAAGPVWQSTVAAPSGSPRSIASSAWDGKYIYVAAGGVTLNGTSYYGNISALDPTTGAFIWRTGVLGFMTAGVTIVPGLLIEPYGAAGHILFLDPATGNTVRDYGTKQREDGEVQVFNGLIYVSDDTGNLIAVGQ